MGHKRLSTGGSTRGFLARPPLSFRNSRGASLFYFQFLRRVGEVGIPEIQSVRGFETLNMNKIAEDGINFMRMYTEPACTPSRAAVLTGRYAIRSGMHTVSFPVENSGMDTDEVTIAEVLSKAGYATAFYGKWHLGDTEPSYAHNQGFDEAFFTPYNQVPACGYPRRRR